jgi:6-phospho-beta-glucosidase
MKLAVVGGGGVRTPLLVRGLLARQNDLHVDELVLLDPDAEALELIGLVVKEALNKAGNPFRFRLTHDAEEAITGADFVLTTLRVGGIQARIVDEQIGFKHGVLGQETTGAGGFAYALRTIPVMLHYAALVRKLAPNAWLINFSNPAGLITEALTRYGGIKAFGICDTPPMTLKALAHMLTVPAAELRPDYLGLNHLGWFRGLHHRGRDLMPEVIARVEDLSGLEELRMFDPQLIRTLGMVPTEYLYFFYYRDRVLANLKASGKTRGEVILDQNHRFFQAMREARYQRVASYWPVYYDYLAERQGTYMRAESGVGGQAEARPEEEGYEGVALGMMTSIVQGLNQIMIANVPNCGAIAELGESDVVEVPCTLTASGPVPLTAGRLPSHGLGLVQTIKAYERLTVEAAMEGSREKALTALTIHPLVGSYPLAEAIFDDYLTAHARYLPQFKG